MEKVKKRYIIAAFLGLMIILAVLTNPTKQEYIRFDEKRTGFTLASKMEIERKNFILFSTYAPKVNGDYGIVHLGFMGSFFQISEGQYDYPWWLELFN